MTQTKNTDSLRKRCYAEEVVSVDLRPGDFVPTGIALIKRFVVPMPRCVNPGGLVQTG